MREDQTKYHNKLVWAVSIPSQTKGHDLRSGDTKLYLIKLFAPNGWILNQFEIQGFHDFSKRDKSFKENIKEANGWLTHVKDQGELTDLNKWSGSPDFVFGESMREVYDWKAKAIPKAIQLISDELKAIQDRVDKTNKKAILNFDEIRDMHPEFFL